MKYPKFLKEKDLIGITALSNGTANDLLEVKTSFNHLKKNYRLIVTKDVYGGYPYSASKEERGKEFNELLDEDIKMLLNLRGGDFLYETLELLNYEKLVQKNIWVMGYSDPSTLLYILTTKYDLATIYGFNAKSFDDKILLDYQKNALEIVTGNLLVQKSFMDRETFSINGDFTSSGIIIGGCLDAIRYLFGTKLDKTKEFIEKYRDKNIIWYFDIYAMNSVDLYLTLLQMDMMGYFKYSSTFLFGTIHYPEVIDEMEYSTVLYKVFGRKNIVYNANIGHVKPTFTIINGSYVHLKYENKELEMQMGFLDESDG